MNDPANSGLPRLPQREADSHKGDYGRALLIGGSLGMTGAIGLAGVAALRSGAGLVTVATPEPCLDIVAAYEPCYMTAALPSDGHGRISSAAIEELKSLADTATVVACGPGLGRSESLSRTIVSLYNTLPQPAVFDADALFALSSDPEACTQPSGPRILTPHPGEFARLVNREVESPTQREELAVQLAERLRAVIVLKGHHTLVTDRQRKYINRTGNPGMATGGSGDVLTGIITGLLAQGLEPFEAAQLGVYLHGMAGDLAAAQLGQVSLIASDLITHLPVAFQQHAAQA